MLEQAEVVTRRSKKHGHLIEWHAASGFVEHAADDLDRLAPFAGRREQAHIAARLALRRPLDREDMTPQVRKIRRGTRRVLDTLDRRAETRQRRRRHFIAFRHGGEHRRRARRERGNEVALDRGVERHVEKDDRQIGPADVAGCDRGRGQLKQGRAIVHCRVTELLFDARQQLPDVGSGGVVSSQLRGRDAGQPQFVDGARQRLREAGHRRDRREVRQLAGGDRVEDRTRGHGFRARVRRWSAPALASACTRRPRRQLGQAEARQAKRGSCLARDRAGRSRLPRRESRQRRVLLWLEEVAGERRARP